MSQLKCADKIGGFADYEVVAICEGFAQGFCGGFRGKLAKRVQGGELFFELALARHGESVTRTAARIHADHEGKIFNTEGTGEHRVSRQAEMKLDVDWRGFTLTRE